MEHILDYYAISENQRQRLVSDWSRMADEPMDVKCTRMDEPIYAFGSELACLRLYYRLNSRGRVAYSANQGTWYYSNQ